MLAYSAASLNYEKFLHQQSKATWLCLGDDSTRYFHSSMKSIGIRSIILSFVDNGTRIDDFKAVKSHFLCHFRNFMGTANSPSKKIDRLFISQASFECGSANVSN